MIPFWKKTDKHSKPQSAQKRRQKAKPAVPRTAQQSIPMQRMFEDGTCRVKPNYYTRTIQYQDINYQLAQQEDKTAIFEEWCSFLNFFDSSIKFELSFVNMATDSTEFEKSIRIPFQKDGFDDVRAEYSQMLRQQLAKGNNGLTKTKFITFGVEGESMAQVKPRLDHIQNDLLNNFHRLGVQAKPLNGVQRLKLMHDNLEFFNTHPFLVTFVMGIILSLEQQKADIETIRAVRVAAMGPLGGIGDAIFWFTLVPITAGITSNMAINGSLAGPILFLLIFNIVQFACRFFLMYWSYNLGTKAIDILTANAKEFTRAASMLGVFIVGALTSNYGGTTVATVIENGDSPIVIQSILDGVLPKLIPLALTLGLFFLMKKKNWKPVTCIALLLVIGLVGAFFGIFA